MITNQEIETFLEHFGTAGMKWGVRNKKPPLTKRQKAKRNKKRKQNIQTGVVITGIAGIMVLNILGNHGRRPVGPDFSSQYRSNYNARPRPGPRVSRSVADVINAQRDVKINAVRRTFREGHMDKEQLGNFTRILNTRYDRRVREATSG